jgi:hypothetical protein
VQPAAGFTAFDETARDTYSAAFRPQKTDFTARKSKKTMGVSCP